MVKSLTSRRIEARTTLYTSRIAEDELAPSSPWFIQECIEADRDVTVVFVRGGCSLSNSSGTFCLAASWIGAWLWNGTRR